jgi:hypothetical protein
MKRLVDLFSGCGGLSLGFDLYSGPTQFKTCLALDIEPSATRLFNANFSRLHNQVAKVGRSADVCWYDSVPEVHLLYLSHLCRLEDIDALRLELHRLNFAGFLEALRRLDEQADAELEALGGGAKYASASSQIGAST